MALAALAIGAAVAPMSAAAVDYWYSRGFYAFIQPIVTSVSSLVPFAVLDLLIAVAVLWMVVRAWRLRGHSGSDRLRAVGRFAGDVISGGALVYLLFLALWGLN